MVYQLSMAYAPRGAKGLSNDCSGVHVKTASSEELKKPQNDLVTPSIKKREPVEDTDEGDMRNSSEKDVDSLAATLGSCNISTADHESGDDLAKHLSDLTVKDDDTDENETEEAKSSSSVITVDPPSLPHDEEEEKSENSDSAGALLESRGPTAGKPAAYKQGNDSCNRIASKGYYSHNFDRYMPQPQQYQPQQPAQSMYGFTPGMDGTFTHFSMAPQVNSSVPTYSQGGKRGMDDDEDNPFKYTRPEMGGFMPQPDVMNDLNMGGRNTKPFLSMSFGSGGQVFENTPQALSPPAELGEFQPRFDSQFSMGDVDNILEVLQAQEQTQQQHQQPHMTQVSQPVQVDKQNGSGRNTSSPGSVATSQPPSVGPWTPGTVGDEYCGQYAGMVGPASVMSDDHSMMSAPDDHQDYINSYFDQHREDLKDALWIVAKDIEHSEAKKKNHKVNNCNSTHTNGNVPQSYTNMPPAPVVVSSRAPQMGPQQTCQADARPNKLPIAPLPKTGSAGNIAQKPAVPSMPVVVVPNTMAPQGHPVSTAAPVTSSQLIMLPPNQPGQQILVVVTKPAPQPEKKKAYVPILPKMPSTSNTPSVACEPSTVAKTEVTSTKVGPIVHSAADTSSNRAVTNGTAGGQPSPCMQPPAPVSPGKNFCPKNKNGQQPKMLNIARRLVASMTTEDLQFKDNEGDTYLHVSVCKADRNMVQALLERMTREKLQSMINSQNSMRQTPLYLAVSSNHPEMVELLIQYGADVNLFAEHIQADGRSKEVKAALHCAASNGAQYLATLQALLSARELMIDLVNSDGHTALHCAILEHGKQRAGNEYIDNLPIIQALIKHGADPNAQGKKSGKTALMYALESRNISLIEHIITLVDPSRLRTFLKTPAFDGSTCLR
nr:hypothetical protein BaRGS_007236 [Batillaria attramentaria]